jgi:hypothetical protein
MKQRNRKSTQLVYEFYRLIEYLCPASLINRVMLKTTAQVSLRFRGTARRELLSEVVDRVSRGTGARITHLDFSVGGRGFQGQLDVQTPETAGALLERVRQVEGILAVTSV